MPPLRLPRRVQRRVPEEPLRRKRRWRAGPELPVCRIPEVLPPHHAFDEPHGQRAGCRACTAVRTPSPPRGPHLLNSQRLFLEDLPCITYPRRPAVRRSWRPLQRLRCWHWSHSPQSLWHTQPRSTPAPRTSPCAGTTRCATTSAFARRDRIPRSWPTRTTTTAIATSTRARWSRIASTC